MKLDFNGVLLDLTGKAIKNPDQSDAKLNISLANNLVMTTGKDNLLKIFEWGLELAKSGILDLDTQDQDLLRKMITESDSLYVITKGRLLEVFKTRETELKKVK